MAAHSVLVLFVLPLYFYFVQGALLSERNASYACNNSPDLCSRSYSNITYLGAHDSPFTANSSKNSISFTDAGNQNINSTAQLSAGVRLLSAQVHNSNGEWHLCHTSCNLLDVGKLSSWLADIKTWMDANPYDVVTILLVNSDNASPSALKAEFDAANISSYGFVPSSTSALATWPTLQEMIASNTRLVTFVTPLTPDTSARFLLSEFNYVFENPYNVTSATSFSCVPERPPSVDGQTALAIQSNLLPLVNHIRYTSVGFGIETPDTANITSTNAKSGVGSLGEAASTCTAAYGRKPVYFLVDYFDQGSTLAVVDGLNGITAVGRGSSPSTTANTYHSGGTSTASSISAPQAQWSKLSIWMVCSVSLAVWVRSL